MARVLVTGMAGFTGPFVAQALAARGHEVVGAVRDSHDRPAGGNWPVVVADLADPAGLRRAVAEVAPDRVVHLAAISFVAHGDVRAVYEANLIGSVNLLEALAECAPGVERILLASSGNVYGNIRSGEYSESDVPRPANHYGISKLAMEQVAAMMAGQLPIIVARPFNYVGKGQSKAFIIPKLIDCAKRRQQHIRLGNINVGRDFSDVRTVADCYARLLDEPEAVGGTFNVCSGKGHKLTDVIADIENLADIRFDIEVDPALVRGNEIAELFGSRARLEAMIGPVHGPSLRDTFKWMLEA